jgi:FtsH-binding integral membrane protein
MHVPTIDEPVKLNGPFWATLCLAEAVYCWYFQPWSWDYPIWYRVVSAVLFPFLGAIVIYCVTMFFVSVLINFRSQKQTMALFFFAIAVSGIVLAFAWVEAGFRNVPPAATFIAGFLANTLFSYLRRKRQNQNEDTTHGLFPSPGTAGARRPACRG